MTAAGEFLSQVYGMDSIIINQIPLLVVSKHDYKFDAVAEIPGKILDMQFETLNVEWNSTFVETTAVPVVIPIVIDGFRRSFDKKGLRIKKKNILQSMEIKAPLEIDYDNETTEEIVKKIEFAIEQHPSFLKVVPQEELEALEALNKMREWKKR